MVIIILTHDKIIELHKYMTNTAIILWLFALHEESVINHFLYCRVNAYLKLY